MFCNKIADLILACRELIMSKNIVADGVKVGMLAPITMTLPNYFAKNFLLLAKISLLKGVILAAKLKIDLAIIFIIAFIIQR